MTINASVYIATSLDGYIARRDGSIDWLNEAASTFPQGEDCGYKVFMDTVDVLIMGRKTFEQVLTFGEWPYGTKPVVVLSHASISIPDHLPDTVSHSSESPQALMARLAAEGIRHVYVDGGRTIQGFLAAGLIDEVTITTIPVILGGGIPLFAPGTPELQMTHVKTTAYEFGPVQTTYAIQKPG